MSETRHNQGGDPKKEYEKQERERRFLVKYLPPEFEKNPKVEIPRQGYVAIDPNGTEVRIRMENDRYIETIKNGFGEIRGELNRNLSEEEFEDAWPLTEGRRINKTRYKIPHGDYTIELNFFHDNNEGLILAEVEFNSAEAADYFVKPDWLGDEVTHDERYNSASVAVDGIPEDYVSLTDTKILEDTTAEQPTKTEAEEKTIPEFEKNEGVDEIIRQTEEKLELANGETIIIEIAGGSASGKTSAIAKKVKEHFGDEAVIFSMDDYYKGIDFMNAEKERGNELNWDQPEAVDIELYKEHLEKLKNGEDIDKPVYEMKTGKRTGTEKFPGARIIIVEGLFALNDQIKDLGDVKAFVDIGFHGRILRRILRDVERTGQRPADILKYFSEVVEPMHEKYVQSTIGNADLIVKNEYNPKIEAERSGLSEVQIKYRDSVSEEKLRALGADYIGTTMQVDFYYNPHDRNLIETDEMLRIREEGGRRILTYKGPRAENVDYRKRPKFEFEIDKETEQAFLAIYGEKKKIVQKVRQLYQLNNVVFSIDKVFTLDEKDEAKLVGKFIEIRGTDKGEIKYISEVVEQLGLREETKTTQSYFEM